MASGHDAAGAGQAEASSRKRSHRSAVISSDSDEEVPEATPTVPEKKKYCQGYLPKYSDIPGIKPSKRGRTYAYCAYCKTDFLIAHSGSFDIARHREQKKHKTLEAEVKRHPAITHFMPQQNISNLDRNVIKAETMYTDLITELNLPLTVADKFNKIHSVAFPDSQIAKKYQCGRDKTTAIVKFLGKEERLDVAQEMRERPFSLATDGSSDVKLKQYPVVVSTFNLDDGVRLRLLGIPCLPLQEKSTGRNICDLIVNQVQKNEVSWDHFIAFGTDNAPVMTGKRNGVIAGLHEKNNNIYLSGCPCHLVHISAEKAAATLPFTPVGITEALVDTYYYLDKSSNRLAELEQWQQLFEVEHQKILKHVATRWLSVGVCLERVLENWEALKNLFREAAEDLAAPGDREKRMFNFYRSPTNRLLCLFLKYVMKIFDTLNTRLQQQAPLIHTLRRDLHKMLRDLLLRYKTPPALYGKTVTDVNIETERGQRTDADLMIGDEARAFLSRKDEVGLRDKRIEEFYTGVRKFYMTASKYIKDKLPLNEELLRHAEVADTTMRLHGVTTADLEYFINIYPSMLPPGVGKETVLVEFAEYQTEETLPTDASDDIDKAWVLIGKMKDSAGIAKYRNLAYIMLSILTIPHSNAQCERIFSAVRQNRTWKRGSLTADTVEALILSKSRPGEAQNRQYSTEKLTEIKSAYYRHLKDKQ